MAKVNLRIIKDGKVIFSEPNEISDAASFAAACANVWQTIHQSQLDRQTSIGAVMEHIDDSVIDTLNKSTLVIERT